MILQPTILSLLLSSLIICGFIIYSLYCGCKILKKWDLTSGSELQLQLERRTYLISTIVTYLLIIQVVSLFLYINIADTNHNLFAGAMCAAGTLSVNNNGYITLYFKISTFFLSGIWLIINEIDNKGYDYPLIRIKYIILIIIAPLLISENLFQINYLKNLDPDIITSCCGSLFSSGNKNVISEITSLPPVPAIVCFYISEFCTLLIGLIYIFTKRLQLLFSVISCLMGIISVISLISVFSLYIYQLPSHHCPFCLLQKEYYHIGYPIYLLILTGTITGTGVGIIGMFKNKKSISTIVPIKQKKLALLSVSSFFILMLILTYCMYTSQLELI